MCISSRYMLICSFTELVHADFPLFFICNPIMPMFLLSTSRALLFDMLHFPVFLCVLCRSLAATPSETMI